ncbi:hypothetical protein Rs2_27513 [Raphanus sativus]|uniref:RING-type E3 ubiquitin transferase n=1 Tax=Raphanus sativus TaxID=3726 RepID=A0A6J0LPT2_RAPSA|nr:RING-H2 finger protein ATL72-like [Raphanus sativus]KAJ4887765.1 hypothetical protein Rs2_27513 [Raphanus sativus]
MTKPSWEVDHVIVPAISSPKRMITMKIERRNTCQTEIVISVDMNRAGNGHLDYATNKNMEYFLLYHEIDYDSAIEIIEATSKYVADNFPAVPNPAGTDLTIIVKITDFNEDAFRRIDLDVYMIELGENRRGPIPSEEYDECSVCFEEFGTGGELNTLVCGHSFHHHCVLEWVQNNLTCPCCRVGLA